MPRDQQLASAKAPLSAANKLKLLIDNKHARKLLIPIKEKTKSDIEKWGKSFAYLTCQ